MEEKKQDKKEVQFMGGSKEDLREFPEEVKNVMGKGLLEVQKGFTPKISRPLPEFGSGVRELRNSFATNAYRVVYWVKRMVYVLHAFNKKSKEGKEIPKADKDTINARLKAAKQLD